MSGAFGRLRGIRAKRPRTGRGQTLLSSALMVTVIAFLGAGAFGATMRAGAQVTERDFPTSEIVPQSALAYINIPLDEEADQWALATDLLDRAGLSDALAQAEQDAVAGSGEDVPLDAILGGEAAIVITDDALNAAIRSITDMAGGDLGLAPAATEDAGTDAPLPVGAALILDARAPDTAFTVFEAALSQQADDAGSEIDEIDYQETTIQFIPPSAAGATDGMALARLDDLIVVAPTPADLEPLIDTAEGNIQPLADFGPYDDVKAEFDQDFLLFGFFNGVAAAEVQRQLGGVGLSSTAIGTTDRYTGLLIYADDLGFRFETVMMAAAGKSLSPASANFDSELAARTPDDVLLYLNASDLGRTGALDAAGAAVISVALGQAGDAGPTAGQTPEDYIAGIYEQSAQVLGVNLQTDLFQQMVGEYALWFSAGSGGDVNMLLVSEVEDPGVVTNALAQLTLLIQGAAGGTASITTRQIGGNQLSVIDSGDGAPAEYGVVDGNFFVFGVGTAIDDFVDGPVDTLADNEQFQEVMDALPSDVNGMVYIDLAQIIPLIESGAATASGSDGSDETTIEDASPDCANYDTQEEAQDAYDAGEEGTFDLDQDFDGTVCEDFFDTGVGAADVPATDEASSFQTDLSGILAFGLVAYDEGGVRHTSSILLIEG